MEYEEEDFLQLSGLQHFAFCRRQWALIHIEQLWAENIRTVEGELMHDKAHDADFTEKRGNIITVRDMRVFSRTLGISGACDIVELISNSKGISVNGREGKYTIRPVEYKHGKPKESDMDEIQLAAQTMCLEEMMCCCIDTGMMYYGEIRRRISVNIDDKLRTRVKECCQEMHELYEREYTPKVKPSKKCNACSIKNLCLPKLMRKKSASEYILSYIEEEEG
jgi:CRISPR-associated exonuclease Cas4